MSLQVNGYEREGSAGLIQIQRRTPFKRGRGRRWTAGLVNRDELRPLHLTTVSELCRRTALDHETMLRQTKYLERWDSWWLTM
jgi:hypothetical protein